MHPATAPGHYSLEETRTASGALLLKFLSRFDGDDSYNRNTERLLKFLAWIAAGELPMRDTGEYGWLTSDE